MKNFTISKIYELGTKLGLNKLDMDIVLVNSNAETEQASFSIGPCWYPGNRYGAISFKDF